MALTLSLTNLSNGLSFPNCYIKVDAASLSSASSRATIFVRFYRDSIAREENKEPLQLPLPTQFEISGDEYTSILSPLSSPTNGWQQQCYEALKLLPFFKNAVDI